MSDLLENICKLEYDRRKKNIVNCKLNESFIPFKTTDVFRIHSVFYCVIVESLVTPQFVFGLLV
jgi:hypothetical protein